MRILANVGHWYAFAKTIANLIRNSLVNFVGLPLFPGGCPGKARFFARLAVFAVFFAAFMIVDGFLSVI